MTRTAPTFFCSDGHGKLGLQEFKAAHNRSALAIILVLGGMLSYLQSDVQLEDQLVALCSGDGRDGELQLASGLRLHHTYPAKPANWASSPSRLGRVPKRKRFWDFAGNGLAMAGRPVDRTEM